MSTRMYNFRSRTDNGGIPPSRVPTTVVPLPPALADGTRDPPPHMPSSARNTGSPPLLYSEVVRSRTPSPRRETEVPVGQGLVSNPTGSGDTVEVSPVPNVVDTTSSEEDEPPEIEENIVPWTTVERRRARSLDSPSEERSSARKGMNTGRKLTKEQTRLVETATTQMTTPQKEVLRRRQEKVVPARRNSPTPSQGEGPSKRKGKGIDPREWGNVNISRESLDVDAQATALESIAQQNKSNNTGRMHAPKKKGRIAYVPNLPAESRPVAQIATDSYLGAALRRIKRSSKSSGSKRDNDTTTSSNESYDDMSPSDGGDDSDDSSSGSSYSSHHRRRRDNRH